MLRNKRLTALLLAALLLLTAGAALAEADLIAPEDIKADEVNYNTSVAEKGDFVKTVTTGGVEYYPLVTPARYHGDTAIFEKWMVKRGDVVTAGDVLVKINVPYDEVKETRLEMELERIKESYETGREDRQADMDALQTALAAEKDEYARKTMTIQLEKARLLLEQYVYQQEYDIASRTKALEDMREKHAAEYICAPCDGIVDELVYFHVGDRIYENQSVCQIAQQEVMLIGAKDSDLRYGMTVTVETGVNKYRQTLTGRVVAAADCLPKVSSSYALVELDPFVPDEHFSWKNIRITGDKILLKDVLLIARKASVLDGGKYRVTKVTEDGVTQKRYIVQGLASNEAVWVVQGLDEGEAVIID